MPWGHWLGGEGGVVLGVVCLVSGFRIRGGVGSYPPTLRVVIGGEETVYTCYALG